MLPVVSVMYLNMHSTNIFEVNILIVIVVKFGDRVVPILFIYFYAICLSLLCYTILFM